MLNSAFAFLWILYILTLIGFVAVWATLGYVVAPVLRRRGCRVSTFLDSRPVAIDFDRWGMRGVTIMFALGIPLGLEIVLAPHTLSRLVVRVVGLLGYAALVLTLSIATAHALRVERDAEERPDT